MAAWPQPHPSLNINLSCWGYLPSKDQRHTEKAEQIMATMKLQKLRHYVQV